MSYLMIVGGVVMAILAGLWQMAEAGLDREKKARVTAEMQRDQFAKGLTQCRADIADKNRILFDVAALPDVRKRICAQRVPTDPCCRPAPAAPAEDKCKP